VQGALEARGLGGVTAADLLELARGVAKPPSEALEHDDADAEGGADDEEEEEEEEAEEEEEDSRWGKQQRRKRARLSRSAVDDASSSSSGGGEESEPDQGERGAPLADPKPAPAQHKRRRGARAANRSEDGDSVVGGGGGGRGVDDGTPLGLAMLRARAGDGDQLAMPGTSYAPPVAAMDPR
jgi:hypothetical protein